MVRYVLLWGVGGLDSDWIHKNERELILIGLPRFEGPKPTTNHPRLLHGNNMAKLLSLTSFNLKPKDMEFKD